MSHSTTDTLHTQHLHLSLDGKMAEVAYHSLPGCQRHHPPAA